MSSEKTKGSYPVLLIKEEREARRRRNQLLRHLEQLSSALEENRRYAAPSSTKVKAKAFVSWAPILGVVGHGRSLESLAAASLYLACEECACPMPQKAILPAASLKRHPGIKKDFNYFLCELRHTYGLRYPTKPSHWEKGIFNRLAKTGTHPLVTATLRRHFVSMAEFCELSEQFRLKMQGKVSRYMALAMLYVASRLAQPELEHLSLTQAEIGELFFVSEVTIRTYYLILVGFLKEAKYSLLHPLNFNLPTSQGAPKCL